ncbi:hemoblobin-interacting domain-containing protein [Paenibacillus cremeus]|uniref:DUF1533 domain-containing protein n=1 Tax=Paenibacillus cremeus TaxID=2163881 RepID=A0A559K6Q9_9BACL|nr:hemoblobin-interacting domain-containing protein [Paenibacillus cremeus]TVY07822.1 DUF1533 domain-containing protein [Paenibacillus cremeus]
MIKLRSKLLAVSISCALLASYVPQGREVYAAYTPAPINDNFDSLASGSAPVSGQLADYTVTVGGTGATAGPTLNALISNAQQVSPSNSLSLVDGINNQYVRVKKRFTTNPSTISKVVAEASIYSTSSAASAIVEMNLLDNTGAQLIRNSLNSSALKYGTSLQTTAPGVTLPTNAWYKLRLEADAAAKTYDIYVNGALVVSQAAFTNTTALDTIQFSTGSSNVSTFYIDNVSAREVVGATPVLAADMDGNTVQSPMDLTFSADPLWQSSITGITVDGTALSSSAYSISDGIIRIASTAFPTAKTYKIVVSANGYFNARVDQVVVNQALKAAPVLTPDTTNNTLGASVDLTFADDPAWRSSITGITVDGATVTGSTYLVAPGGIYLDSSLFSTAKAYDVRVNAAGYSQAVVTQTVEAPVAGVAPVMADHPSKQYPSNIQVALSSSTVQAAVYYKIDGVDTEFIPYTGPITVKGSTQMIAKAVKNGEESAESTFYYSIISDSRPAITNSETFAGWTNRVLDTIHVKEGVNSAKWSNPASAMNVNDITADWSQYDQLEVWAYSGKATGNNIYIIIDCDNNTASGYDYFIAPYKVDWVGWKKITIPLSKFTKSTSRTTFAEYRRLIIHPRWYANDPPLDTSLEMYFDDMVLTKKVIDVSTDSIIRNAKPDMDLDYTFTLTNKSNAPTSYQLALNPGLTSFDSSYTVSFPSTTEQVAPGGELQVDVHVKVPSTAAVYETKVGVLKVTSNTDGSEISVKLQSNVVAWASTAGGHPNTMVTSDQLAQAKAKVSQYAWAKDYLTAVKTKADIWLNTAIYYPDRPGGHSIWYYCGDTPLIYDYNEPHNHICPDDGKVYSGGDYDFAWRSTTHRKNIDAAKALAVAYALTDDPRYAQKTREILLAYAKYYPSYPLQSRNGRLYWQSLDEAVQIIKLAQAYDLTVKSGLFTTDDQFEIEMNLFKPSAETLKQVDNGTSNFQTWHNAAIGIIGVLLSDNSLMDVSINGKSGFLYQMQNSVLSDGFWLEGAIGYHFYVQGALFMQAEALSHVLSSAHPERDMYANPSFKKMFEVTLGYVYPDLGVSNNNDSGGYPSSLVGDEKHVPPVDYEGVYAHYKNYDPGYAHLPEYESLLSMIYNDHHQIRGGKLDPSDSNVDSYIGEQAVFYGPNEITPAPPLQLGSKNFEGIGHAVLRSGTGQDEMYALVDYGMHGESHGHFDKLNLDFYGQGTRLAPDFGSTATYGISLYNEYYKKTFSHNTVLVDGQDQAIYKVGENESYDPTTMFLDSKRLAISTNTANHVYNGVNQYERTLALTNDYAVDFFNVSSTTGVHQYDWMLHGLGSFQTDMTMSSVAPSSIGTANGYQYLRNTRQGQQDGVWSGTWTNDQGTGLRVIGLNNAASNVIVGELPGPATQIDTYYDTVINRVNGLGVSFVSILEPVNGSSKIAGVTRLDDSSFMVGLTNGFSDYIYHNSVAESGKVSYLFVKGHNLNPAFVGSVATTVSGGTLTIGYEPLRSVQNATVIVYAPNVTSVMMDGISVPFTSNNGYVMVSLQDKPANQAPVLDAIPAVQVQLGQEVSFTVHAVDADGDALEYSGMDLPADATLDAATGTLHWLPLAPGEYPMSLKVADGMGAEAMVSTSVTVTPAELSTPAESTVTVVAPIISGVASAVIPAGELHSAIDHAADRTVNLQVLHTDGAAKLDVRLPAQQVQYADDKKIKEIFADSAFAKVSMNPDLLKKSKDLSSTAVLELSVAKEPNSASTVYEFKLNVDGTNLTKLDGNDLKVEVPYALKPGENPKKIVIYYRTDDGKLEEVKDVKYHVETGTVEFKVKQL